MDKGLINNSICQGLRKNLGAVRNFRMLHHSNNSYNKLANYTIYTAKGDWHRNPILLAECSKYAVNPLKWLRYIGYAIYGAEGYLSTLKGGNKVDDYTVDIEPDPYFFISEGKSVLSYFTILSLIMFLDEPHFIDVDTMNDRMSDASDALAVSEGQRDFRQRVTEHDVTYLIT